MAELDSLSYAVTNDTEQRESVLWMTVLTTTYELGNLFGKQKEKLSEVIQEKPRLSVGPSFSAGTWRDQCLVPLILSTGMVLSIYGYRAQ